MSSASKLAINGSLPIGCCLVGPHPIEGITESRLIHIQHHPSGSVEAWLVDLDDQRIPRSHLLSHLVAMVQAGTLSAWHWTPGIPATLRNDLSLDATAKADRAWCRIQPLVDSRTLPAMLDKKQRGQLMTRRALEVRCGRNQIYRNWVQFLKRGMTRDALIPRIEVFCPRPWRPRK